MDEASLTDLRNLRLAAWGQTPTTRLPDAPAAVPLIERMGLVTLFPASPELPNLYHAYTGDPGSAVDSAWDSPSGEVYTWRWKLGRPALAFYTAIVRGRPTWVSWAMLPAVIRLRGELRTPDELFDSGEISADAYRIAEALDAGGVLSTNALRREACFPSGKEKRAAYLRAMAELDNRLLVAKVFEQEGDEMSHALVSSRFRSHVDAAERLSRETALEQFLLAYLPSAAYAVPPILARHLGLPPAELRAGLERLVKSGRAAPLALSSQKDACFAWRYD